MTRQEAESCKKHYVTAKLLVELTNNVVDETIYAMRDCSGYGICNEILEQFTDEKKMKVFKDTIFDALQAEFTINELKILSESDENSRNYYLMYERLYYHFVYGLEDNPNKMSNSVENDNETYAIIFYNMKGEESERKFDKPTRLNKTERKHGINFNKIDKRFSK